jgi:diguanylate cyclase (GGDEF)-like protein/PAS domain S-box-containing protein
LHHILVVERSATLRLVLVKLLKKHGYRVDAASDFQQGLELLQHSANAARHDGVVLGWPVHTDPVADELLALLSEERGNNRAVLIMAQEAEPAMRKWVAQRARTALVLWENYAEALECLAMELAPPQEFVLEPPSIPAGTAPIRALFVDDSPTVRVTYRRMLTEHGYIVDTASSVNEGYEMARQRQYDIAVIDFFMPEHNGDELCRRLRADPLTAGVTTTILTGTYADEVIKDALEAGAVECMFKNEANALFLARIAAISRTIRVQKSIEAERRRLESILSSVGDGVYGVDNNGLITFINPAARRILGYTADAPLIGMSPHTLFHHTHGDGGDNPRSTCFLEQAYAAGKALFSWDTVFWHRNGSAIPVECTVYPLRIQGKKEGSVVAFRDISERRMLEERLRWQATHDPLTEMFNRRYFEEQLENEVSRLRRSREQSALVYFDLDRFKYINDTAGHKAGDQLLIQIGRLLRSRVRSSDLLARIGGDEFALIMRNADPATVQQAADSFRGLLSNCPFQYEGKVYRINCSAGVAVIDQGIQSPGEALSNADIACHLAKTAGRNQTHLYVAENDAKMAMDHDLGWSSRLGDALQHDRFVLHYQPILPFDGLDLSTLPDDGSPVWPAIAGSCAPEGLYEVLVRLQGDDGRLVSPAAFLPTAERFNLMRDIDRWVINHALGELGRLNSAGGQYSFSINLSAHTLGDRGLGTYVEQQLAAHGVQPQRIVFEITETAAISNIDTAVELIGELKRLGCRFALDDFGCGFSSFYHLKHLPVDYIKLDGSFVQGMANDSIDRAMVTSMNDIAHSLGRHTIAEYVESADILHELGRLGVDYVQGYFISHPLPAVEAPVPRDRRTPRDHAAAVSLPPQPG